MSTATRILELLEKDRAELSALTRDKINAMINAVAIDTTKFEAIDELHHLISYHTLVFDTVGYTQPDMFDRAKCTGRPIIGLAVEGDEATALLEFVPSPLSSIFFRSFDKKNINRCMQISLDGLMEKIKQQIAKYDDEIEKTKEAIKQEAPTRRATQREHITNLMHKLAEIRTLSMVKDFELTDHMMGKIASLDFKLREILTAMKITMKRQFESTPKEVFIKKETPMKRKEKVLVVVDMQNDFIDGVLDNPAAKAIIPEIVKMIREWDGKVVATRDTHFEDTYKNSIEGQRLPIHCVYGTHGWQIQEDIQKALDEKHAKIIDKHNFGYINWPKALFDIDSTDQDAVAALVADWDITICDTGTCTDICDASAFTMQRAWFPSAIIQVAEKATAASFNNKYQAAALDIARCMLCDVI